MASAGEQIVRNSGALLVEARISFSRLRNPSDRNQMLGVRVEWRLPLWAGSQLLISAFNRPTFPLLSDPPRYTKT